MRLRNSLSSCLQTALPSSLHTNMVRRDSKESTRNEKKDWGEMTPEAIQALCVRLSHRFFQNSTLLFTENADFITSSPMHHAACYIATQYCGDSIL